MRALLLEGDNAESTRIDRLLAEHGWLTETRRDFSGDDAAAATGYDLVMVWSDAVDERLRDLLQRLRRAGYDTVIIVLGNFSVEERIRALNFGADEFLGRDAPGALVLGRALALLRLHSARFRQYYRIGDLQLDLIHRRVTQCGRDITLSQREFQLLVILAQRAGETLPRSFLIEALWGHAHPTEDNTLDVHVSRLRRKLSGPANDQMIATVRGVGYRLDPPLQEQAATG